MPHREISLICPSDSSPRGRLQNPKLCGRVWLVILHVQWHVCVSPSLYLSPGGTAVTPFLHVRAQPLRGPSDSARGRELGCGLSGAPAAAPPDPGLRAWCCPPPCPPAGALCLRPCPLRLRRSWGAVCVTAPSGVPPPLCSSVQGTSSSPALSATEGRSQPPPTPDPALLVTAACGRISRGHARCPRCLGCGLQKPLGFFSIPVRFLFEHLPSENFPKLIKL